MATKYTTKTAALSATKADMRQVAVSKKIEIGSTDTKTIIQDGEVSAEDLLIGVDVKNEETGETTRQRQSVKTLIEKAQESAAIQVGRDADKNWSVDETAIDMVKKISFLGDYVNVVPVTKEDGSTEVKLYIGENKSLEEADRTALDVTLPTTSEVLFYTDDTESHALPTGVTANETKGNAVVVTDGTSYGSTKFTAKGGSFTADQTDCIWVRTTYDYGTASAWGKVQLNKNRGTYNRDTATPTNSTVSVAAVTDVTLPSGVSMNVGNYILTAEDDAQYGKVPGRCETAYDFTINWATIATKGGGHIKVEWGFGSADAEDATKPSSAVTIKSYERYFTEKKSVAMADSVTASVTTPSYTSKVSGLEYLGKGTTVTVTTPNITNSQYKTAASTKRLTVVAGGTTVDYTTDDLTLVEGTITKSDAVYKLDGNSSKSNVISLSSTGNGSATVKATPHGAAAGTERSATSVANFWGSIPTSTATKENFGVESGTGGYRMKTPTSTSVDFVSTEDVTTHSIDVNGTDCCSAVCQYGKLYHPASAAADAKGKSYSTTKPACFIRTFTGDKEPNTFTLSGINLIQSGKVQVWWKDGNNWYNLSTAVAGSVELSDKSSGSADTITKTIKTSAGENQRKDMLIAIVVQPGASYIGPITATFA